MTWPLDDIAIWLERYNRHRMMFVRGATNRIEALDALRNLRFRDDALRIEMLEWERDKDRRKLKVSREARKKLKEYINEPGTVTPTSSL